MELYNPGININDIKTYDTIDQVFILFVIVNGGFLNKTLNNNLRNLIRSDIKFPYFILFFTIFFVLKIVKEEEYHPIQTLIQSIKILLFYYVLMKLDLKYLIIVLLLLLVIFLIDHYKKYHKDKLFIKTIQNLNRIEYILYITIYIIISINLIDYYKKNKEIISFFKL
tara:strand:- start:490 stop:993 length:504 start_codon:yes stop_codon:yes gene_type:complete